MADWTYPERVAKPPVPRQNVDRAIAARRGGATWVEAAAAGPIGERTLREYMAREAVSRSGAPRARPPPPKAPRPSRAPATAVEPPPSLTLDAIEAGDDGADLLAILRGELRYAIGARKRAKTDAGERAWSKRVDELVKAVERLAPPLPPPPDLVRQELARLDGEVIALLEQHLPQPVDPKEIAA